MEDVRASLFICGYALNVQAVNATTGPAGHTVDSRVGRGGEV